MSEFVMVPRDLLEKAAGMVESYSECVAAYVKADDLERWDYVPGIDDCAEDLRAALAAAPPSPPPSSVKAREIDAFEAGYIQGHDATVEGRYADPSDAAQDYVRTLLAPTVDERAATSEAPVAWRYVRGMSSYIDQGPPPTQEEYGMFDSITPLYTHPASAGEGVTEESVTRLALWLCEEADEDPTEMIYENGEPWGSVFSRHEDRARKLLEAALGAREGK